MLAAFQERLQQVGFQLPPDYRIEYGGEADARGNAIGNLLSTVGVLGIFDDGNPGAVFQFLWSGGADRLCGPVLPWGWRPWH